MSFYGRKEANRPMPEHNSSRPSEEGAENIVDNEDSIENEVREDTVDQIKNLLLKKFVVVLVHL